MSDKKKIAYIYKVLIGIAILVLAVVIKKIFADETNGQFGTLLINFIISQCSWLSLYFIVPSGKFKPDISFGSFFGISMILAVVSALAITYPVF